MAQPPGISAIAIGAIAAGSLLTWSGVRGASVLRSVQSLIKGDKPTGENIYPVTTPIGESGPESTGPVGGAGAMVTLAIGQVGTREGRGNSQKYSRELKRPSEAWCADFLDWLAMKTGNSGIVPQTASAPGMAQRFGSRFVSGSSGIRAGDFVFYHGASNGWHGIGHCGIAITDNISGKWQSVEGNYGDRVALNNRTACQGYARPNYGS